MRYPRKNIAEVNFLEDYIKIDPKILKNLFRNDKKFRKSKKGVESFYNLKTLPVYVRANKDGSITIFPPTSIQVHLQQVLEDAREEQSYKQRRDFDSFHWLHDRAMDQKIYSAKHMIHTNKEDLNKDLNLSEFVKTKKDLDLYNRDLSEKDDSNKADGQQEDTNNANEEVDD